jgi:hypothetical protein
LQRFFAELERLRMRTSRHSHHLASGRLQFRQQIGIKDQGVRQTLEASIEHEIEAPGLNSRLYIDFLLMLLLTRLMRCASNFATPCQPDYVKGGLPN